MSLYNKLFKENKDSDVLLGVIGLNKAFFERYRDIWINPDGTKVTVLTRLGGGNRKCTDVFDKLKDLDLYLGNEDDKYDNTYAYVYFKVPDKYLQMTKSIAPETEHPTLKEMFEIHFKRMEDPNSEESKQAERIAEAIVNAIKDSESKDQGKNTGGINFLYL